MIVSAGTMRMRPPAQSLGPLEKHPSPLKSLPADPASPRDTTPEPSASPSSLLCLYAKSGRGRLPGLCPVVLVYHLGPALLEPGSLP